MVGSLVVIAATTVAAALKNNLGGMSVKASIRKHRERKEKEFKRLVDAMCEEKFQQMYQECLVEELHKVVERKERREMEEFEKEQNEQREFENSEWRIMYQSMSDEEREAFWSEKDKLVNFYGRRWMQRHHKNVRACDPGDPTIETTLDELVPGNGEEMMIMTPSGTWKNGIKFHNKKADEILRKKKEAKAV